MQLNEDRLNRIIAEELSKADVSSMIKSRISSELSSNEFKKKIKELSSEVVSELFKVLWQRNSLWKNSVTR